MGDSPGLYVSASTDFFFIGILHGLVLPSRWEF